MAEKPVNLACLKKLSSFTGSPVSRQNSLLPRLAATARRWWPPIEHDHPFFGDDLAGFVHDDSHAPPPTQRADQRRPMVRNLSKLVRAPGVPTHEDYGFRTRHAPHRASPLCTDRHKIKTRNARLQISSQATVVRSLQETHTLQRTVATDCWGIATARASASSPRQSRPRCPLTAASRTADSQTLVIHWF